MPLTRACTRLLRLGRLIVLYDANNVTLSATTNLTFLEDVGARFQSYGWQVQRIDGLDPSAVDAALAAARAVEDRPSLIVAHTHIGYGSPHKQDTWHAHGEPLGVEEVRLTKRALGWPGAPAKRRDALRQRRAVTMAHDEADAFVFLGATGDLARRQIFPALQVHVADLETRHLRPGDRPDLTFYWPEADRLKEPTSSCASSEWHTGRRRGGRGRFRAILSEPRVGHFVPPRFASLACSGCASS